MYVIQLQPVPVERELQLDPAVPSAVERSPPPDTPVGYPQQHPNPVV